MDLSIWVAVLSFLAATLSAIYARWVWGEARRTNLLALHASRMEVFRSFHKLRQSVQEQGVGIELDRVGQFYHPSRESRFYFSERKASELLIEYFDKCFALASLARRLERTSMTSAEIEKQQQLQDRLSEQEQLTFTLAEAQLEKELQSSVRRHWFRA